ncbi:MAG: hypothetical protein P1P88_22280 [Bacteroidales bacterium]|nr:hypothetical protein [Bacteroidales bacterium]
MNIDEFLNNEPSITFDFEEINDNPNDIVTPGKMNNFFITYYDALGTKIFLTLDDIWGFYNGLGIFVSHDMRPYELLYLGSISVLRYEHYHYENALSQAAALTFTGTTITGVYQIKDVFLDLTKDTIVPAKRKHFERLISRDIDFYNNYKKDKKTNKQIKPIIYLQKFNNKYPILITEKGIELIKN